MALAEDQVTAVLELLQAHPDWTDNAIRQAAQLPGSAMFAIRSIRKEAGIPPAAASASGSSGSSGSKRRRSSARRASASVSEDTETLDSSADMFAAEPSGPKRRGANKAPQSMLAPVLPQLMQMGAVSVQAGTAWVSRGVAPMTAQQAKAVAIPALRLADRNIAKYVKKTGKVTADQEDIGLILMTVVMWFAGWMLSLLLQRRVATPAPSVAQPAAAAAVSDPGDLFAGSEPAAPAAAPAAAAAVADDPGDLFAGSEPAAPAPAGVRAPTPISGAAGVRAPAVSESTWQAIMPTDLGEVV